MLEVIVLAGVKAEGSLSVMLKPRALLWVSGFFCGWFVVFLFLWVSAGGFFCFCFLCSFCILSVYLEVPYFF